MHRIEKDALFVIDASYLLYRSFYAIKPLHNSAGIPTQATFGFCRAIKKILDDFAPSHLVVVWDSKVKGPRHEKYPAYKANRQKPPNELWVQKDYICRFLEDVKIAQITVDGCEGDDVIGALAEQCASNQVVLVCPDKDMYQLLSEKVLIFDPFKDRVVDQNLFKQENGFPPASIPFFYALLGDSSDNIPGVAGIGKKTAQELVIQFASLQDLYANLDRVPKERTRKLLAEQKDAAFLSYELFLLNPPPLDLTRKDLVYDPACWAGAATIFRELEFTSLLKDLQKRFPQASKPATGAESNASLFGGQQAVIGQGEEADIAQATGTERPWKLGIIQDEAALDELVNVLKNASWFTMDTETTGGHPLTDTLVGMSFAATAHEAFYVPVAHHEGKQLDRELVLGKLRPVLESTKTALVMHNAKFDQLVMYHAGINIPPISFDTLIAASLIRKRDDERIGLKSLSATLLNEPMQTFKDVLGKKRKTFAEVPIEEGAPYAAHDALQTYKIEPIIRRELYATASLKRVFNEIEMPFYQVLLRMEEVGILLDAEKIKETALAVGKAISTLENKIIAALPHKAAAEEINFNSPRQVEKLLFDDLGLPVVKKSDKGSRSTDQEVLQELRMIHPIPGLILQHRELTKLKTTYLEPLPTFINPNTGRVHTSFSQTLVVTGRLSSSDPNLQNIPASEGFGMQIREAFYAPRGSVLLSADYAQVELRILAHLSKDPTLMRVFLEGHDIHAETAAQLFDVPVDKVTHDQRQLGKRINFSIIYGVTPYGLAKDLGIKQGEAKAYIEKYFQRFPKVASWIEKTIERATADGYVETLMGRRRYIPELAERNRTLQEAGKRMATNTPVQGTQAEIMKIAMINIDQRFKKEGLAARMILQIHDELVVEVPNDELPAVEKIVQTEMGSVVQWEVPLKVTVRSGKTWADITK